MTGSMALSASHDIHHSNSMYMLQLLPQLLGVGKVMNKGGRCFGVSCVRVNKAAVV